jgi:ferrous iron transport protein B
MILASLSEGQKAVIVKIKGRNFFKKRVMEMGFVPGKTVGLVRKAPFKGPVEFSILGSFVVLRYEEAALIEVDERTSIDTSGDTAATFEGKKLKAFGNPLNKDIKVAFIGNPMSGKTSLYNMLTGAHDKVGNYGGVTIESASRIVCYGGYNIRIIDLPGTYSLGSDEAVHRVIRDFIYHELPDVVVNVVDASNLERNLYLTTELIDMDVRLIMALNMSDILESSGDRFDSHGFARLTGVPVVHVSASRGSGREALLDGIIAMYCDAHPDYRHLHISYGGEFEKSLKTLQHLIRIKENSVLTDRLSSRFLALRILLKDKVAEESLKTCVNATEIISATNEEVRRLEKEYGQSLESHVADARYGFIAGAIKETYQLSEHNKRKISESIDALLMHKVFGFPIFLGLMWLMFASTFKLGAYPMEWISNGVSALSSFVLNTMAPGMLRDLLVDGLISGMGGVIVFLPNILILYFFIALMEDTGYMSRAVFIMDKIMHKIGLHGKSFIPLVMGFGCNVPAILASRMLHNRNERMITILINPFISCNARLPVYILFISAFFPNYSGTMLFLIYLLGVLIAVLTALLLQKSFFKKVHQPFVMELPPYRMPSGKALLMHMWRRSAQYLKKIGGVILIASVLFWALSYFPRNEALQKKYELRSDSLALVMDMKIANVPLADSSSRAVLTQDKQEQLHDLSLAYKSEQKEKSYLGDIGHFIEPVIRPLGFDWRIGISIISGIPAKEIIVSSLSILYHVDENSADDEASLSSKLKAQQGKGDMTGHPITPLIALSFMIFVLLYLPCIGTLTAIIRETGSWKWGVFIIVYSFGLAWLVSFAVYSIGSLMGF